MLNVTKNPISPSNLNKGIGAEWADALASWSDTFFGWSDVMSVINIDKAVLSAYLELQDGTFFLLQDGGYLDLQGGSGALVWNNVTKN